MTTQLFELAQERDALTLENPVICSQMGFADAIADCSSLMIALATICITAIVLRLCWGHPGTTVTALGFAGLGGWGFWGSRCSSDSSRQAWWIETALAAVVLLYATAQAFHQSLLVWTMVSWMDVPSDPLGAPLAAGLAKFVHEFWLTWQFPFTVVRITGPVHLQQVLGCVILVVRVLYYAPKVFNWFFPRLQKTALIPETGTRIAKAA